MIDHFSSGSTYYPSTHADRQGDDISVTLCLFVILFVCLYRYGFLHRG